MISLLKEGKGGNMSKYNIFWPSSKGVYTMIALLKEGNVTGVDGGRRVEED
jgi:hypothetical protein